MPLRLPPLSSLRFFEAAGRHQSFKLAAAELNVTPSAISHGIVGLEQAIGIQLFVRDPRGLRLTPEGADYLAYVSEAFSLLATGTQRLPDGEAGRGIRVTCAPTFAARWLLPRLPGFLENHPTVGVTLDTSRRQAGFPVDGFDFAIRMSRAPTAGPAWTRLFGERLVPVCSPAYRDSHSDGAGGAELRQATLIHVSPASEDWQSWLDRAGVSDLEVSGGLRVDTIQLAFEAAAAGLGVALGRRPLVDRELASGTLVEASGAVVAAETAYWLVSSEGIERRSHLAGFRLWLLREAGVEAVPRQAVRQIAE